MMKVLAAIDNSAAARPVLSTATAMASVLDAVPVALHVREDGAQSATAIAAAAGMPLQTASGPTVELLVQAAAAEDVEALVLGARGRPGGRRPAGRTALAVMSELEKPLVVVPPIRRVPERIERVLVPLDGTEASAAAVRAVIRLAEEQDIEVVVLHVQDEHAIAFSDQPHHETEAWGREFVARWCRCPAGKVQLELRVGLPGEHVVDVARELDVDLIALGWRRNLEPGRAAVVREALGHSEVPVLLIPLTPLSAQDPSVRRLILASASR